MLAAMLPACRRDSAEGLPTEPRFIEDLFGNVSSRWIGEQVLWSWSRPAVFNDLVIGASGDQRLTARDRMNGAVRWSTVVTSVNGVQRISGRNLLIRGGVVVAAVSRNTVGLDAATGREIWSYGAPTDTLIDPPGKPATVELAHLDGDDSTVYVPAWGASVSAVDIRTGSARWVWRPSAGTPFRSGANAIRVSGDTVFATVWHSLQATNTSAEGWLVSIDRRTGVELGKTVIMPFTNFTGQPLIWRDLVIVGGAAGRLWAINRADYTIAWQYVPANGTGATSGGPVLFGDMIYADAGDSYAMAVRASDGSVVWRAKTLSGSTTDLYVTDKRVYFTTSGHLNIIDRATGRYVARTKQPSEPSDGSLFSSAIVSFGNQMYVTINRGIWCFEEP
jgi:outer membrane protein assembly factor BamB